MRSLEEQQEEKFLAELDAKNRMINTKSGLLGKLWRGAGQGHVIYALVADRPDVFTRGLHDTYRVDVCDIHGMRLMGGADYEPLSTSELLARVRDGRVVECFRKPKYPSELA